MWASLGRIEASVFVDTCMSDVHGRSVALLQVTVPHMAAATRNRCSRAARAENRYVRQDQQILRRRRRTRNDRGSVIRERESRANRIRIRERPGTQA